MFPTCPICRAPGGTTRCERCEVVYHEDCWEFNEGCAIFGCDPAPLFIEDHHPQMIIGEFPLSFIDMMIVLTCSPVIALSELNNAPWDTLRIFKELFARIVLLAIIVAFLYISSTYILSI